MATNKDTNTELTEENSVFLEEISVTPRPMDIMLLILLKINNLDRCRTDFFFKNGILFSKINVCVHVGHPDRKNNVKNANKMHTMAV